MLSLLTLFILAQSQSDFPGDKSLPSVYLRPKPKARAGGADDKVAPVYSFGFTASVRIGGNQDIYTLSIGVLIENIWVTKPNCDKCKSAYQKYNISDSNTSFALNTNASYTNEILTIEILGSQVLEIVTIEDYPTLEFPISVADRFVDVLNLAMDGILGLGTNESSVVYKMFQNGLIDQPIYSLSFLTTPFITFGTPNFLELSLVVETQQTISYAEPMQCTSFTFRNFSILEPSIIEFSSISSYITGPFDVLEAIFKILVNEGCHYEEELLVCNCDAKGLPEFRFKIQGQELKIQSKNYLIQLGALCFVALKSGKGWILGEPFFKTYFFQVDIEKKEIMLALTTQLDDDLLSPFETQEGITVMIGLGIASIAIYIFAYLIYVMYEDYKINQALMEQSASGKRKHRII